MSISRLRSIFNKDAGASYSNEYQVIINIPVNSKLQDNLIAAGFTGGNTSERFDEMMFLCDEASLPGTFAATNEIDGIYAGRMVQYAHGRLYNDIRLSFIQTNQMYPQKFFETWMATMFPERALNNDEEFTPQSEQRLERSNITTISYYDDIVCDMTITKDYKNQNAPDGQQSLFYQFKNMYPYSIESVPLSYGASTLNKLRVSLRYEKHVALFSPD